jgi:hypothetical protein
VHTGIDADNQFAAVLVSTLQHTVIEPDEEDIESAKEETNVEDLSALTALLDSHLGDQSNEGFELYLQRMGNLVMKVKGEDLAAG